MPTVAKTFDISSIILSEQLVRKGRLSSITWNLLRQWLYHCNKDF